MKIMFFSPHSAIWAFAFPEALIAETLRQGENEILYITCGGQFSDFCNCMTAGGLLQDFRYEDKQIICKSCHHNRDLIKREFMFKGHDLEYYLMPEDKQALLDTTAYLTRDNFLDYSIDGFNIGRIALYELILQFKKGDLIFSEDEWRAYLIAFKNTLASFFACRHILDQEKPDRVILYNSAYSINHVLFKLAEARDIPAYFLNAGQNLSNQLQTLMLGRGNISKFFKTLKHYWHIRREIPCSKNELESVTSHFMELFKGNHFGAYSAARKGHSEDIRGLFGIAQKQKVLVATMSSYDERMAAEICGIFDSDYELIFPKQVDWIKALIQFIRNRKDLFLIIRVHPREFPNKREGVKSEHAKILEQELKNLPENVKVNWPTDNLSIYDLAEVTDVFLNAWSSVGEEMSLFGLPVVVYSPELLLYPADLNYVGVSQDDFFDKIDQALKDGWSFERIRMTYRWYVLKLNRSLINIAESFSSQTNRSGWVYSLEIIWDKIYWKFLCLFSSIHRSRRDTRRLFKDCKNRAKALKAGGLINSLIKDGKNNILEFPTIIGEKLVSLDQETEYIKSEIKHLGIKVKGQGSC